MTEQRVQLTPEQELQLERLIAQAEHLHRLSIIRRAAKRSRPRPHLLELTADQIDRLLTKEPPHAT